MIRLRLMGGLGNQMFQYATLRSYMLEYKDKGIISLDGITNKTHNVYSLNYFNVNKEVEIKDKGGFKSTLNHLIYGFYCVFLVKRKNGYKIMKNIQPILNKLGIYCVPDGYIKLIKSKSNNKTFVGYFQSIKYFDKYKDVIREELHVKTKVLKRNIELLEDIKRTNSVCIHIRRGDYVGSNHQVCSIDYYIKGIKEIKKKTVSPKFFIFSDDIDWVRENIDFKEKVTYVEKGNPNYEELRLMYSCKHFIISNSSFSWWAQYLTDNKDRITVAPTRWFQNSNQRVDIYQDDWIKIEG